MASPVQDYRQAMADLFETVDVLKAALQELIVAAQTPLAGLSNVLQAVERNERAIEEWRAGLRKVYETAKRVQAAKEEDA